MFRAAVCQMKTELDPAATLTKAGEMVKEAGEKGAQVICLPEMFSCPYDDAYFIPYTERQEETKAAMAAWAKEQHVILIGGSIPEKENGHIYNTSFVFNENGEQIARHRKIHLFDVNLPGMKFQESATFTPGEQITVFDTSYGRFGVAICFDIRFPELFRAMARRGAEMIFLPAQFNGKTGPAHWEMTLRMRALDNEIFLAGASAARYEGFSYECWGHSLIADPYGALLVSCEEKEQILMADIDFRRIQEVRAQLPTFDCLRTELYSVAE